MGRRDAAGVMLRDWRARRRFSQLDLSLAAGVSAKHLSYVETGRSRPSPEMVLHLCEHLEVPLRERNAILLAAGHAPSYPQLSYDDATSEVRELVDLVVAAHRYPAIVVDSRWNLVAANAAASLFLVGVAEHLLVPTTNVLRLSLHADGLRPRVLNFDEYAGHVLARLRRVVAHHPDPALTALLQEFADLDVAAPEHTDGVVMPLVLDVDGTPVRMITTIATFGSPREVTLSELAIETFYPADPASAAALERLAP
ncbi:MAG: helix-turn-helix transcriptional regulator [Ilumatobacteraceae bacterium]